MPERLWFQEYLGELALLEMLQDQGEGEDLSPGEEKTFSRVIYIGRREG